MRISYTNVCVCVNTYSLLIVRVMKPLCSKYGWGSMWPLKKKLWILFGWLPSDFCCLCKSLCYGCCHFYYVIVSGSAVSLVELFYSTSHNWIGMVDFRNIPQFLRNKEIWEILITACRIVYPNTNNKQKENLEINNVCTLGYLGLFLLWVCFWI